MPIGLSFRAALMLIFGLFLIVFQRVEALETDHLQTLRWQWAQIKYQQEGPAQLEALQHLVENVNQMAQASPTDPSLLAWQGTILSTYANAKGGLGALKSIDAAKMALERSIQLDERAEGGLAHAVLGALYYRVPSWPVSFRNYTEAEQHLSRSLAINPVGIDQNYFYGEFLKERHEYNQAKNYLKMATEAPARPEYSLADEGRRQEAFKALAAVNQALN